MRYTTSSTDGSRAAISSPLGISNRTPASDSAFLARTIRCAIVGTGTTNARAISSVANQAIIWRVSAIRASGDRTGWQAVNISRRTSSWTVGTISISSIGFSTSTSSRPSSSTLRSSVTRRRMVSTPRRRPTAISQAPGLSGTPDSGHCSSAATSASCARSSASPTSRTTRASPAISRAASIRQTASIVRWTVSGVCVIFRRTRASLLAGRDLVAQLLLPFPQFRREVRAEVLGLGDPPDLDLGVLERRALEPFGGLLERGDLPDPETADQLLGLGERTVDDVRLRAVEAHSLALDRRGEALPGEHHAGLDQLLVELA